MAQYLDSLYRSIASTGTIIIIITTCIVIIYLLFNLAPIIENLIQRNTQETVVVDNKEIHINVANRTYEFNFNRIRGLFWKLIGISYLIGFALCFAIVVVIPLAIIVILLIKRGLNFGVFKGIRSVLRLASSK